MQKTKQQIAKIIAEAAVEAVAKKNSISVDAVRKAVEGGNQGAIKQLTAYIQAGMSAAYAMQAKGEITIAG